MHLYEKYKNEIEQGIEITIGESFAGSEEEQEAFSGAEETDTTGYRVFTKETIKELEIEGIEREYLVNIAKRNVICLEGFEYDGEIYYTLEQLTDKNKIGQDMASGEVTFQLNTEKKVIALGQ